MGPLRLLARSVSALLPLASLVFMPATSAVAVAAPAPRSSVKATAAFSSVHNPTSNAVPSPDYNNPCWAGGAKGAANTPTCHTQALAAINHQHAVEHIRAIALPRNYWTLAPALQIFVITNLERVSRGLKPVQGVNAQMNG